jgi:REP element-mobilizing transposase RayT
MDKNRNHGRAAMNRVSTRLKNWDYGWNAAYFITICTKKRNCFFGNVADRKMQLSEIGRLANDYWYEIPQHFSFVQLDAFVVMPDYVHGILVIESMDAMNRVPTVAQPQINRVPTAAPPIIIGGITGKNNPMLHENLSRIIRWYKGRLSFEARKTDAGFGWHSRFHDHIIRNEGVFQRIRDYIGDNPGKWGSGLTR